MLRNYFLKNSSKLQRSFSKSPCHQVKDNAVNRQVKIMSKLLGNRVSGSKKWYPSPNNVVAEQVVFKASQFGKSAKAAGGKQTTRRMTVLNKLFMSHITDQMATGSVSENLVGKGLQVTAVKISPDFAGINVYWRGGTAANQGEDLQEELNKSAGKLRHELSQLGLMGEVPRIRFVRDRTHSNMEQVDHLLRNMHIEPEEIEENAKNSITSTTQTAYTEVRRELYGNSVCTALEKDENEFPVMRHDVLGVDHKEIMSRIHAKMKKSKQAWDQHQTNQFSQNVIETENKTVELNQIAESAAAAERFEKFLASRRDRKQTPERKKYIRADNEISLNNLDAVDNNSTIALSEQQRRLYDEEDYINEDVDNLRKF